MTDRRPAISIVGLGKLGAPMAACFAAGGFTVVGVDLSERSVEAVNARRAPVAEPGLEEILGRVGDRLSATMDVAGAIACTDVTFVIVPTPSDADGTFSLQFVLAACERIGEALSRKDASHLVAVTSTVMPGSTGGPIRETLERASGKVVGVDFGLCYSPEFIALGSVIRDLLNPDFLLVGESDPAAGDLLLSIYRETCENDPPAARMNFVNAELAKLAVNTYVTTKITFANTIARICERLPEADVDVVTAALGLDTRIGPKYLRGGVGYGGPCFPRDNVALAALARGIDAPALLAEATDTANRAGLEALADLVAGSVPAGGTVAVLGLAYKPGTDVVEESPGVHLVLSLRARGLEVVAWDPVAIPNARSALGASAVRFADSLAGAVEAADVVVLTTPWPDLRDLDPALLDRPGNRRVVFDCWRLLPRVQVERFADVVWLGEGPGAGPIEAPIR